MGCTAHTYGLYVSRVASSSPAEEAGLKKGDIIMNAPFGDHGIRNTGDVDMEVLVFEAVITK